MVVILMGVDAAGLALIARELATELGWPVAEAGAVDSLPRTIAHVLGRREDLVIISRPLDARGQSAARGDLHGVRFVDVAELPDDRDAAVHAIRREFGL